jgi:glycerol-3-phosphate dehydrogenase
VKLVVAAAENEEIRRMTAQAVSAPFDAIGGGVNGCGIARDALAALLGHALRNE